MDVIGLLQLLGAGLVVSIVLMGAWTAWTLTHPPRRSYAWAVSRNIPGDPAELLGAMPGRAPECCTFESWTFTSRGHDLPAWDVAGDDPQGPIAIITHGWGDSRVVSLQRVPALLPVCARIVLWDLPGHGDSRGSCSMGTHEADDLLALIATLGSRSETPLILVGFSLGAGVSIVAAAREDAAIRAVVAEAPYRVPIVPARNVLALYRMPRSITLRLAMLALGLRFGHGASWMLGGARRFDRAAHARGVKCPLLVLHPAMDQVCPVSDGRDIASAAPRGELVVIEDAGHTNLWTEPAFLERSTGEIQRFIRGVFHVEHSGAEIHSSG